MDKDEIIHWLGIILIVVVMAGIAWAMSNVGKERKRVWFEKCESQYERQLCEIIWEK